MAALCLQGAEQQKNKYFTLDNGLQIYLQERHQLPLINVVFAVDMGSKDETPGTNGIVHLLEHLVLLGSTASYRGPVLIKEIRKKGAYFNAHTDHDVMTLEFSLPAKHLDYVLDVVKEKIFALKFDQKEIEREKEVIIEEIHRIMDDPMRLGTSLALQGLFRGHAYGKPVFGDSEVIKKAGREQLAAFYRKYFVPRNCALSIVGDFDTAAAAAKIKQKFSEALLRDEAFKEAGRISNIEHRISKERLTTLRYRKTPHRLPAPRGWVRRTPPVKK